MSSLWGVQWLATCWGSFWLRSSKSLKIQEVFWLDQPFLRLHYHLYSGLNSLSSLGLCRPGSSCLRLLQSHSAASMGATGCPISAPSVSWSRARPAPHRSRQRWVSLLNSQVFLALTPSTAAISWTKKPFRSLFASALHPATSAATNLSSGM